MQDLQRQATEALSIPVTKCRMCKSTSLKIFLDLGNTPPADQFRKKEELDLPEIWYPLRVLLCEECGLSQLSHVVNPQVLYQYDYPYESSTTSTGKKHWDSFASAVCERLSLAKGDLVVDIGSNVGVLLDSFSSNGMQVVGVDPAPNIVDIANERGVPTYCDFYSNEVAARIEKEHGKASVIVGTNVFAHIDDLDAVLEASNALLKPKGVFIFESPHFGNLVQHLEYDTIYHEHLSYLSLAPVEKFVEHFGFEVFAIEETEIHGGSFRVYVGRKGDWPIDDSVDQMRVKEKGQNIHDLQALHSFADRVVENRQSLMSLLEKLLDEKKKIAIVSTPAKGMTLLNYCGITKRHASFAAEKARLKIGRYTPGGHIPIKPDEALIEEDIDYALLLAWNFADEIIKNNKDFQDRGGKFILPIPEPRIV